SESSPRLRRRSSGAPVWAPRLGHPTRFVDAAARRVALASCAPIRQLEVCRPGLKEPWQETPCSQLAAALSVEVTLSGWGFPGVRNGHCEVSAPQPGSQCSPPPRRPGSDAQQTPARLRLDRSVLRRPGRGQLLPAWDQPRPPAAPRGRDMSAQEPPQGRRFPIEAGDSPGLAAAPESQDSPEPVATEHNPVRPLRRCPGCHCLTLLHVPIDVYLAMGGSPRARAT
ncbi:Protein FAM229A, partial [Galemys pyrenaicus]